MESGLVPLQLKKVQEVHICVRDTWHLSGEAPYPASYLLYGKGS